MIKTVKANNIQSHIVVADLNQDINYKRIKVFIRENRLYNIY